MGVLWWYGYTDKEGALHVLRYFSQEEAEKLWQDPSVSFVFTPFEANTREDAIKELEFRKDVGRVTRRDPTNLDNN